MPGDYYIIRDRLLKLGIDTPIINDVLRQYLVDLK